MSAIDRIAPTHRPAGSPAGHQRWSDLLFVHYGYPSEVVRSLVPKELDLDPWNGRMFVGLVPFAMRAIRPAHVPRWAGLDFLETNLRTYVVHRGEPGVYFFSLEASSRLAVRAARWGWGLPYFDAAMQTSRAIDDTIEYETVRRTSGTPEAALRARYRPGAPLGPSLPGTLEHFLLERYLLFTVWKGAVWKGHVSHVPYPARRAEVLSIEESLTTAAGLPPHAGPPETAHFSDGVDVDVFGPHRLGP